MLAVSSFVLDWSADMTNADYYVNEYKTGGFPRYGYAKHREGADFLASIATNNRIGVWHVRLKEGKR